MRYLTLLLLLASASANAVVVSIKAGDHPAGTDLSEALPGATMATVTNYGVASGYAAGPVLAVVTPGFLDAGPNLIGHNLDESRLQSFDFRNLQGTERCFNTGICFNGVSRREFNALKVSFDVPTNYVEVRVHFIEPWLDGAILRAFNSAGEAVATCRAWGPIDRAPQYGYYPTTTSPTCGKIVRRYNCLRSGERCDSEHVLHISRAYPDIAYVLWGGEADSATSSAITQVRYRQFSEDCTPPKL